jgi:hypothetical protein
LILAATVVLMLFVGAASAALVFHERLALIVNRWEAGLAEPVPSRMERSEPPVRDGAREESSEPPAVRETQLPADHTPISELEPGG